MAFKKIQQLASYVGTQIDSIDRIPIVSLTGTNLYGTFYATGDQIGEFVIDKISTLPLFQTNIINNNTIYSNSISSTNALSISISCINLSSTYLKSTSISSTSISSNSLYTNSLSTASLSSTYINCTTASFDTITATNLILRNNSAVSKYISNISHVSTPEPVTYTLNHPFSSIDNIVQIFELTESNNYKSADYVIANVLNIQDQDLYKTEITITSEKTATYRVVIIS